jgi:succinyl-CoA synthetase beta subunit
MASAAGGMDIEEVAETHPEEIFRIAVNPIGLLPFQRQSLFQLWHSQIPADLTGEMVVDF